MHDRRRRNRDTSGNPQENQNSSPNSNRISNREPEEDAENIIILGTVESPNSNRISGSNGNRRRRIKNQDIIQAEQEMSAAKKEESLPVPNSPEAVPETGMSEVAAEPVLTEPEVQESYADPAISEETQDVPEETVPEIYSEPEPVRDNDPLSGGEAEELFEEETPEMETQDDEVIPTDEFQDELQEEWESGISPIIEERTEPVIPSVPKTAEESPLEEEEMIFPWDVAETSEDTSVFFETPSPESSVPAVPEVTEPEPEPEEEQVLLPEPVQETMPVPVQETSPVPVQVVEPVPVRNVAPKQKPVQNTIPTSNRNKKREQKRLEKERQKEQQKALERQRELERQKALEKKKEEDRRRVAERQKAKEQPKAPARPQEPPKQEPAAKQPEIPPQKTPSRGSRNDRIGKIIDLIKRNPDLPVIPMVDSDILSGDALNGEGTGYWMGSWEEADIGKYWTGKDRVYFFSGAGRVRKSRIHFYDPDDEENMRDAVEDSYDGQIPDNIRTDESALRAAYDIIPWQKAVIVYITAPDADEPPEMPGPGGKKKNLDLNA